MNLFLAVVWLVAAVVIFALPLFNPEMRPWTIPRLGVSMGWFALCLCVYNVVRWWTTRRSAPDRTLPGAAPARRRYYDDEGGPQASHEEFRFTEKPPRPPAESPDLPP